MPADQSPTVRFAHGSRPIDELLAKYRPFLRLLADRQLDGKLASRLSSSDIVQQTQMDAFRDYGLFRGESEAQFVAWLKAILGNNIAKAARTHVVAKKRSVHSECQLTLDTSSPVRDMAAGNDSPSAAAMKGESAVMLASAMSGLSDEQYEAIRLRYIEGCSLINISQRMNRSQDSVAGLLKRGLRKLREVLANMER